MGASNPYKTYQSTIKGDDKWISFLKKFQLKQKDGEAFFKSFKNMDKKAKGDITYEQFAKAWKIPPGDRGVIHRFFLSEDVKKGDNEDLLYFQEWAVMNYDFCTMRMDGLVQWTFSLFDPDGSGSITVDEFKEMCRMTMGEEAAHHGTPSYSKMVRLMKELDTNKNGKISMAEFSRAERSENAIALFAPLLELQAKMQQHVCGEAFWKDHIKVRDAVSLGKSPMAVYDSGGTFERGAKGTKGGKKGKVAPA